MAEYKPDKKKKPLYLITKNNGTEVGWAFGLDEAKKEAKELIYSKGFKNLFIFKMLGQMKK